MNPELQPEANLSTLPAEASLTKAEINKFQRLSPEEQEKQKQKRLAKVKDLEKKLEKAVADGAIAGNFDEAKRLKEKIEKEIADLEEVVTYVGEISVKYKYKYEEGEETVETIEIDFEFKLQDFISFYKKTKLDLPPNFEADIREIWYNNLTEIEQSIKENGFNDMLIIPGNIPLTDLAEKMNMQNGYSLDEYLSKIVSQKVDKPRIILFHNFNHLYSLIDITKKTGLNVHLDITGAKAKKLYKNNPENYLSTIEDAIIMERKYFEETGGHFSRDRNNSANWLPGSTVGARLVNSYWRSDFNQFRVLVDDLTVHYNYLGVRPVRYFYKK